MRRCLAILAVPLAFLLINLIGLDRSPVVWIDEVTLNDPAKELAFHGRLRSSVFSGTSHFEDAYFWQPPAQPLLTAAVYKLFGFGIWQTRLPGLCFGAAALCVLGVLGTAIAGSARAGVFASALFAMDPGLIQTARSGRMDTLCLFFALLGTLVCTDALKSAEPTGWRQFVRLTVSGFLIGLASVAHPIAVAWAIAISVLVFSLPRSISLPARVKRLFCFDCSVALPAAAWLAYAAIVSSPEVFRAQFLEHGEGHLVAGSVFARILAEFARCWTAYRLAPLLLIGYLFGVVSFVCSRRYSGTARGIVAVLAVVLFGFNALMMVKEVGFYYLHPAVVGALAAGAIVDGAITARGEGTSRRSGLILAFSLIALLNALSGGIGIRLLALAYQWDARDYRQVERAVADTIPPGSVVWGPPELWYAVQRAGASLRLKGLPSPQDHDYVVVKSGKTFPGSAGAEPVKEFGSPLPAVLGRIELPSCDYRMIIWRFKQKPS